MNRHLKFFNFLKFKGAPDKTIDLQAWREKYQLRYTLPTGETIDKTESLELAEV